MHRYFRREESGFTLVELLVVIVIIGLLTAIAIPIFMNQRQKANDAALISDMRNVALVYQTWHSSNSGGNQEFWDLTGRTTVRIAHPNAVWSDTTADWNEFDALPVTQLSNSSRVGIVVVVNPDVDWTRVHDEGEYCITGTNALSSYDYEPGAVGHADYDRFLFYDSHAGGINTMEELVDKFEDGTQVSCYSYVERYLAATT